MEASEHIRRVAEQDYTVAVADASERVRLQGSIADAGMKALVLANGGAMIALFTFVGNVLTRVGPSPFSAGKLWLAFAFFVAGLVAALACYVFAFLSQDRFYAQAMHETWRQQRVMETLAKEGPSETELKLFGLGQAYYGLGLLASVISVAAFAAGCGFALAGVLLR